MFVHFSSLQDECIFMLRDDMISKSVDDLECWALFALDQPKLSLIVGVERTHLNKVPFMSNGLIGCLQGVFSLFVYDQMRFLGVVKHQSLYNLI